VLTYLQSKFFQYASIAVAFAAAVFAIFRAGGKSAKLSAAEAKLKEQAHANKTKADIDSLDDAAARDRLRKRWSK